MDPSSLDPTHWADLRLQGHRMLDDMFDHIENVRERPVWQPIPAEVRTSFAAPLPKTPTPLADAHAKFMTHVLPYAAGNTHPGFMGWVQGAGTVEGMLAEMLAAGLNANLGGRDQMPLEVERQIGLWMRDLFDFPETASGIFVSGSSTANLIGVLLARTHALGVASRETGLIDAPRANGPQIHLVAYAAKTAHSCIAKAMEISGIGTQALRMVPVNDADQMDVGALTNMVAADRAAGLQPFLVIGTAGTVNTGAIDDLSAIGNFVSQAGLWFHVDGALGALGILAPDLAPRLKGIELADSIALDFHKWGQVPYDAGYLLARRQSDQLDTFMSKAVYLTRHTRGLAAGSPWPCDLGPELSRGFRALKTWFTLVCHGTDRLGAVISRTCHLAQYLKARIQSTPKLELMAPVALNIVCFRFRCEDDNYANHVNAEIVADLHESGIAAPSSSIVNGCTVIRAAIVNHRTTERDIDAMVEAVLKFGTARTSDAQITNHQKQNIPPLMGIAPIMRARFQGDSLDDLAATMIQRATNDPQDMNALMDLSTILQVLGAKEVGLDTFKLAMGVSRLYTIPAKHAASVRLLAIQAPGDLMMNTPLQFLLENTDIELQMLYLMPDEPIPTHLPEHDVAIIALSDTSQTRALLEQLSVAVAGWNKPVLLKPEHVIRTSRQHAFSLLSGVGGAKIEQTVQATRTTLQGLAMGEVALPSLLIKGDFPVIVRPIDSHAGRGLEKIDTPHQLSQYLEGQAATDFFISPYSDYRSADGYFRKYRLVLVDGIPYAGHMAISESWMVHYLNAGMFESAWKRDEEAKFMQTFEADFAVRHASALQNIHKLFGLEYLVMDCAETAEGDLLLFELDPGAVIHDMDPADMFPYKVPAMQKIFDAFRTLLLKTKHTTQATPRR